MKRIIALFLTLCMLVQMMPMAVFAAEVQEYKEKAAIEAQQEKVNQLEEELE